MKRVCTRCGNEMGAVSHGKETAAVVTRNLCETCSSPSDGPTRISLLEFLDTLAAPVILFDSERRAVAANRRAGEYLGKAPETVAGFKGGDVFNCRYARLPEGCGNTTHCSGCTLRRLILDTLLLEKEYRNVPVYVGRSENSEPREPDFLVSTEKKFSLVLLRIDAVRAERDGTDKK
jgi:PAS domain-containing protein